MAVTKPITASTGLEGPNRRSVLVGLPAVAAVSCAPLVAAAGEDTPAPLFLHRITGKPQHWALCTPVNRVAQASRYLLDDGHVVLAEHFHGMRVMIDGAWRDVPSAVMNRRVIGHVVAIYECDGISAHLVTGEVA